MDEPIRIEKYLAQQGIASRREAKALILAGHVKVNGKTVREPGIKINPNQDKLLLSERGLVVQQDKITVAVYKPRGVNCGKDGDDKSVFDVFPKYQHLNTVGRLDKASEGLLLLSNDGLITKAITDRSHPSEKEYVVIVRENVLPWMIEKFKKGIKIEGGYRTLPAEAEKIDRNTFAITLREGKKHQIRRMANAVHLTITSLKRVRINNIELGRMRPGQARVLKTKEVEALRKLVY